MLELQEAVDEGETLYEIHVSFREDNPMNSVGGIQVFAVLKQFSNVLKTIPDFDELYDDVYHPVVRYFVSTTEDPEDHRDRLEISDVTDTVTVAPVGTGSSAENEREPEGHGQSEERACNADIEAGRHRSETASQESRAAGGGPNLFAREQKTQKSQTSGEKETARLRIAHGHRSNETAQQGSVLRVDSRRIDDLLNLVSETVINKASFNQINITFGDNLVSFQDAENRYREMLKELFESLPDYLDAIQRGESVKDVRQRINEQFGDLPTVFDGFHSDLKSSIAKFRSTAQNLGRIASELQEGVMRIRMVPISQIFSRFPRLVRDLSRSLNKKINLEIEGEDTELDKSVIEDLLDPLIHCVRNSIDHGIEEPETRREDGKEDAGDGQTAGEQRRKHDPHRD